MTDDFEEQIKAIEAANADEAATEGEDVATDPPQAEPEEPKEIDAADDSDDPEDHTDDEDGDDPEGRRRSKPLSQRLKEERWKRGEAERAREQADTELAELRARLDRLEKGDEKAGPELPAKPDPETYEYGESDQKYLNDLMDWKLETRDAERARQQVEQDAEREKTASAERQQREAMQRIEAGVSKAETDAKAKYPDFDAKISDAIDARGGKPLPPLLSVGIGVSPVGGDILYRLATDEGVSERLERLASGGERTSRSMAMVLGELEGEYLPDDSDTDLDMSDGHDMARLVGRMRARMAGRKAPSPQSEVSVTNAPEPPAHRTKGAAGRSRVSPDTDDIHAFMREYGSQL